ncbi:hypothetical protein JSE7799_01577 [Jannaschia seosinensis]|uniref:Uncharacterized protein n=1 Tax=Jannaschia seosinensis TaxID=313367 RepID=A0A0M7B9I4_9RHOB|nr:hypothetical protein [Jannaschia seosinensis]CUH38859.1 hypothetical protein JSE7799_01577 [Jannaschia seosinensis]
MSAAGCQTRSPAEEGGIALAACLGNIGRADVAANPTAPMDEAEIEALVLCTAERAQE